MACRCWSGVCMFNDIVGQQLGVCQPFWLHLQIFLASSLFIEFSDWGIPLLKNNLASFVIIFNIMSRFHYCDTLDSRDLHENGKNFLKSCETRLGLLFLIWNWNLIKRLQKFRQLIVVLSFLFKLVLDQFVVGDKHGILKLLAFLWRLQDGVFGSWNESLADEEIIFCKTKPMCVDIVNLAWIICQAWMNFASHVTVTWDQPSSMRVGGLKHNPRTRTWNLHHLAVLLYHWAKL